MQWQEFGVFGVREVAILISSTLNMKYSCRSLSVGFCRLSYLRAAMKLCAFLLPLITSYIVKFNNAGLQYNYIIMCNYVLHDFSKSAPDFNNYMNLS